MKVNDTILEERSNGTFRDVGLCLYLKNMDAINIPFLGLKWVDLFTVGYNDKQELVNSLIRILKLNIRYEDVSGVSLLYSYKSPKTKDTKTKRLPVKYKKDNYKAESVKKGMYLYLKENRSRIWNSGVNFANVDEMYDFIDGKDISDLGIKKSVESYFENNSYKKYRDAYFLIKDYVNIKNKEDEPINGVKTDSSLSKLESREDNFIEHLIEFAGNDDCYEEAIDELSRTEMEDIRSLLIQNDYSVFDGEVDGYIEEDKEDAYSLQLFTGKKIDEIKRLIPYNYRLDKSKGYRR